MFMTVVMARGGSMLLAHCGATAEVPCCVALVNTGLERATEPESLYQL
jgi:hypothetical protein